MVACQWKRSSPKGPAEQLAGGSFPRSASSIGDSMECYQWWVTMHLTYGWKKRQRYVSKLHFIWMLTFLNSLKGHCVRVLLWFSYRFYKSCEYHFSIKCICRKCELQNTLLDHEQDSQRGVKKSSWDYPQRRPKFKVINIPCHRGCM